MRGPDASPYAGRRRLTLTSHAARAFPPAARASATTRSDAHAAALASLPALRVTAKDCGAGFFALLVYAMNQIIWAEANGYAPVVLFGERCRDGRLNRYYDAARGPNMWDYFFHPAAPGMVARSSDTQLSLKHLFNLHHLSTASSPQRTAPDRPQHHHHQQLRV